MSLYFVNYMKEIKRRRTNCKKKNIYLTYEKFILLKNTYIINVKINFLITLDCY